MDRRPLLALLLASCAAEPETLVERLAIAEERASPRPVLTVPLMYPSEDVPDDDPRYAAQDAASRLSSMGIRAFPALVARVDDPRQSICLSHTLPASVGEACFRIILEQVHDGPFGPDYRRYVFLHRSMLKQWWSERSGKSLRELRIESALYSLSLADFDGDAGFVRFYEDVLKELGVRDARERLQPFRIWSARLPLPEDWPGVVQALEIGSGTYLERSGDQERADRAGEQILGEPEPAFEHVLRGLDRPAVRSACLKLLGWLTIDEWLEYQGFAEFRFVTPERVDAWRKSNPGGTLGDFRKAARDHAKDEARRASLDELIRKIDERVHD